MGDDEGAQKNDALDIGVNATMSRNSVASDQKDGEIDGEMFEAELERVSAYSLISANSITPLIAMIVHQLVNTHSPRLTFAVPFLCHPLRVVCTRMCCKGWCNMSLRDCLRYTFKGEGGSSAGVGILPRLASQLIQGWLEALKLEV